MRTPAILLLATLSVPACDGRPAPGGTAPVVAVTLPPIASIAATVAGHAARVHTLLPPGAHPDSYEATPRLARSLAAADLVIRVGAAADAWLGPVTGVPEVVLTEGLSLQGQRGPGTGNPHVWLDPVRVRDVLLPRIVAGLVDVAPDSAAAIRDRADAFADSLTALDAEIRSMLDDLDSRQFVAAHPAWVYFAERYGLEQVGALHASPGSEIGSRELARLVEWTEARGVSAVIAEPQLGRAGVDALAAELGADVEVADALGGPSLEGREDYLSLMRFNARAFARALRGDR